MLRISHIILVVKEGEKQNGNVIWRRESARKGLNSTSGAQFAALSLVKPVVWFARAVVNWRSRSVAKSAYYWIDWLTRSWRWSEFFILTGYPNTQCIGYLPVYWTNSSLLARSKQCYLYLRSCSLHHSIVPRRCLRPRRCGCVVTIIKGSFSIDDSDGAKNVLFMMNSRCFKLCRVYSNSLKMSNVGKFPWSWLLGHRTQV